MTGELHKVKKHILTSILCVGLLVLGSTFVATGSASAETMPVILIIPFNIHAGKDQSFLKPAITDMLYTRLSAENRTVLVEKGDTRTDSVSAEDAVSMGRQQNANYVLFGSITILGTMVSTDAQLVGLAQDKPLLTFNEVGQSQSDIIGHVDHLTTRINETVFGVAKAVVLPPASDPAADDIHTHPEKLVIPGITPKTPPALAPESAPAPSPAPSTAPAKSIAPAAPTAPTTSTAPATPTAPTTSTGPTPPAPAAPIVVVAPQKDADENSLSYWKSESFSATIEGLSIADVDGDGFNEVVFVSYNQIFVYRYQNKSLQEIKTFSHKSFHRLMFVDTADINQNGTPEIFVTDYISSNQRLKSIVLEWNGRDFAVLDELTNWYLRVLKTPASGTLLLGQKRGTGSSSTFATSPQEALFDRDIHEMKWRDGRYAAADKFAVPKEMTLFDFTQGDASNNGQTETVAFLRNDFFRIYDQTWESTWESDQIYGGSRLFFEAPNMGRTGTVAHSVSRSGKTVKYYLPQRIHVSDIDGDGLNEIIVVKNYDGEGGIFSRMKAFKEGRIDCFSYDNIGVQPKWQTRNIAGYISDYVIGDLNNDGINEIVLSTVAKSKSLLSKGKSYIVSIVPVSE
jgi:TolB-like protein